MNVQVTQHHIDNGSSGSALACALAKALRDATNQDWWVGDGDVGTVLVPAVGDEVEASARVNRFRRRFDECKPVKPFEFEIPDDCLYVEIED